MFKIFMSSFILSCFPRAVYIHSFVNKTLLNENKTWHLDPFKYLIEHVHFL